MMEVPAQWHALRIVDQENWFVQEELIQMDAPFLIFAKQVPYFRE